MPWEGTEGGLRATRGHGGARPGEAGPARHSDPMSGASARVTAALGPLITLEEPAHQAGTGLHAHGAHTHACMQSPVPQLRDTLMHAVRRHTRAPRTRRTRTRCTRTGHTHSEPEDPASGATLSGKDVDRSPSRTRRSLAGHEKATAGGHVASPPPRGPDGGPAPVCGARPWPGHLCACHSGSHRDPAAGELVPGDLPPHVSLTAGTPGPPQSPGWGVGVPCAADAPSLGRLPLGARRRRWRRRRSRRRWSSRPRSAAPCPRSRWW